MQPRERLLDPVRVRLYCSDRSAAGDDQDLLSLVSLADLEHGLEDTLGHLQVRFASGGGSELASVPLAEGPGIALVDPLPRQPFPGAEVHLSKPWVLPHLEAEAAGDDLRRLDRAEGVAAVDGFDRASMHLLRQLACLAASQLIQGWACEPCQRWVAFQSVSPCRAKSSVATAGTLTTSGRRPTRPRGPVRSVVGPRRNAQGRATAVGARGGAGADVLDYVGLGGPCQVGLSLAR
jgi:hypothetical protein